jgi:hypothetical protein
VRLFQSAPLLDAAFPPLGFRAVAPFLILQAARVNMERATAKQALSRFLRGGDNQLVGGSVTGADQCCPVFGWDAVPLPPRAYRGSGLAGQVADCLDPSSSDDVGVGSHGALMHNALSERKRLLRNGIDYAQCMNDPAARLRIARLRAGYETGKEAAEALGFPVSTYLGHENGSRGISAKKAEVYAESIRLGNSGFYTASAPDQVASRPARRRARQYR